MLQKIFTTIQIGDKSNKLSRAFDITVVTSIFANIICVFALTFDGLETIYSVLHFVEYITTAIFIVEYVMRVLTAQFLYPHLSPAKARLRFVLSFNGIIDLLTILPAFFLTGFVVLRMLRVVRIFRLFRITATRDSFNVITSVIYNARMQLASSIFIILLLMCASSLCMYSIEHAAQPDVFTNAFSGIWWAVSTILTVGYGDIYPITTLGRCFAIVIAILGVMVVAVPTGILSAGFVSQYQKETVPQKLPLHLIEDELYVGKTVKSVELNYGYNILLIKRGDLSIVPTAETVILLNDQLVVE